MEGLPLAFASYLFLCHSSKLNYLQLQYFRRQTVACQQSLHSSNSIYLSLVLRTIVSSTVSFQRQNTSYETEEEQQQGPAMISKRDVSTEVQLVESDS